MSNTTATWSFSLDCECPVCNMQFDVCTSDSAHDLFGNGLQVCEQDTPLSTDIEVICPHCEHEFVIDCEYQYGTLPQPTTVLLCQYVIWCTSFNYTTLRKLTTGSQPNLLHCVTTKHV